MLVRPAAGRHRGAVTATTVPGLLALLTDPALRDDVDQVAAAVGLGVVHLSASSVVGRTAWSAAAAVVLDEDAARRCAAAGLPHRAAVFVLGSAAGGDPEPATYRAALSVGAQRVFCLPPQARELVEALSAADDDARADAGRGAVIAVIGGRGGAGASVFATALAHSATEALLVDLDPWSGGLDLLLGAETASGLRWPDLAVRGGRLAWSAVREALPRQGTISVLSATRRDHGADPVELDPGGVDAVVEAGRRGGTTVICDVPRRLTGAADIALDAADLVIVLSPCDVRSCAAAAAIAPALTAINANVGLVVRGPSPGGLRAADVAEVAALPLLVAMRPEPLLAEKLERGGLRLRPRSPLGRAAAQVLALVGGRPGQRKPRAGAAA